MAEEEAGEMGGGPSDCGGAVLVLPGISSLMVSWISCTQMVKVQEYAPREKKLRPQGRGFPSMGCWTACRLDGESWVVEGGVVWGRNLAALA